MKKLHNVQYLMDMGCGSDVWRIAGYCEHRGYIFISTPVHYDTENMVITTASGSKYQIIGHVSDDFLEQIKKDISMGGYEIR